MAALVPPGVVTSTLAVPAVPAGVMQVTEVAVLALNAVHALPAMVTPVALFRLVPVMVMDVPPVVVPVLGATELTVGGEA